MKESTDQTEDTPQDLDARGYWEYSDEAISIRVHEEHPLFDLVKSFAKGVKRQTRAERTVRKGKKRKLPRENRLHRRRARANQRDARKLWRHIGDDHEKVILALSSNGEMLQSELEAILGSGWEKLRGVLGGLAKVCKRRGIRYPIQKSTGADGDTVYSLSPDFAQAFQDLDDAVAAEI